MTVIKGSFAATDRTRDPEEQFAEIRQEVVDSLYQTLDSAKHAALFPSFIVEAVENEVWKHPRKLTHNTLPAMTLREFVKRGYPNGLGTSFDVIEKLIAGNERAMLAWDKAVLMDQDGQSAQLSDRGRAEREAEKQMRPLAAAILGCPGDIATTLSHALLNGERCQALKALLDAGLREAGR
jgi:hypothetical protein